MFSDAFKNPSQLLDSPRVRRFIKLIEPADDGRIEQLATESQSITQRNFGKTIRLFAPLYLSNECVNNCSYCGFSRDNPILRTTLGVDQVVREARHLHGLGGPVVVVGRRRGRRKRI